MEPGLASFYELFAPSVDGPFRVFQPTKKRIVKWIANASANTSESFFPANMPTWLYRLRSFALIYCGPLLTFYGPKIETSTIMPATCMRKKKGLGKRKLDKWAMANMPGDWLVDRVCLVHWPRDGVMGPTWWTARISHAHLHPSWVWILSSRSPLSLNIGHATCL